MRRLTAAVVLVACAGLACTRNTDAAVTVLAASSLTEALSDAGDAFTRSTGIGTQISFAGSQTLVTQLAEGARGDVLATADEESMAHAAERNLVAGSTIFATNTLVLVTPEANEPGITAPPDITRPGTRLVLATEEVPIGRYARQALAQLGLSDALTNLVSEEEDTKGVLGKVSSGEADAGIVYATDVTDAVHAIELGAGEIVTRYPIAVTSGAKDPEVAQRFVDFLIEGEGAKILAEAGFGPPDHGDAP